MTAPARIRLVAGIFGLSVISVLCGAVAVLNFASTPGQNGAIPQRWPSTSSLTRTSGHTQLLVFAHPLCSCTAATLNELAQVHTQLPKGQSLPAITILFFGTRSKPEKKENGAWNRALQIASATVLWDDAGTEAKLFGAQTSGLTLLYNEKGDLLFHGGITESRGHEGDNYGLEQLISALSTGKPALALHPVFGCGLLGFKTPTGERL